MTATVTTALSAANNAAKTVTTPAGVVSTQALLAFVGVSSNSDTVTAPGTGTWAEVTFNDNVIGSSNGQLRVFQCLNPASSTAYTWSFTSTRFSIGVLLLEVGATVIASGSIVDIAASLESVAGATHAPPSVGGGGFPTAAGELVVDCQMFRQFNPDVSTCTPPSTGLTWTEQLDFRGNDAGGSGQNVQMAVNTATAGSANAVISTAALNTADANEPTLVARVVIKGGSAGGSVTGTASAALGVLAGTAAGLPTVTGTAASALGRATATASGTRTVTGTAVAALGRLTGTATGVRTVLGTGTAALGRAVGAASGLRTVGGVASAALGGLSAAATVGAGTKTGVASAALGGLSAAAGGRRTVSGVGVAALGRLTAAVEPAPSGLRGELHGRTALVPGAVTVHTVSIAGAINN